MRRFQTFKTGDRFAVAFLASSSRSVFKPEEMASHLSGMATVAIQIPRIEIGLMTVSFSVMEQESGRLFS